MRPQEMKDLSQKLNQIASELNINCQGKIKVHLEGEVVVLTGCTTTFYMKQMAQETCMRTIRKKIMIPKIRNDISVE
jgi:hypothetical protein